MADQAPQFTEPTYLACCHVYTWNDPADHVCITYDGPPCATCGAGTVFTTIAAPGTGQGRSCPNGHYHGTCRTLTLAEVR